MPPNPTVTVPRVMAPPPVRTSKAEQESGEVQVAEVVATPAIEPPELYWTCPFDPAALAVMPKVEVATHEGLPVAKAVCRMVPPVLVARAVRFAVPPPDPPKMMLPSATDAMPVPPLATPTVPLKLMVGWLPRTKALAPFVTVMLVPLAMDEVPTDESALVPLP